MFIGFSLFLFLSAASADYGKWKVTEDGKTCLMVQMELKVNFTYVATDNSTKTVLYELPINQTLEDSTGSKCGASVNTIKVSWKDGNSFNMTFSSNNSHYDLSSFNVNLNTTSLYNDSMANQTVVVTYISESFDIPTNFSYHCNNEDFKAINGELLVSQFQFEAFKASNNEQFSGAKDCKSDLGPDIVPIAVGIALIALIVVVLIAYIVGRRRQQARGYLNIM